MTLEKPFTNRDEFPKHHDHDSVGLYQLTNDLKDRLKIDNKKFKFIRLVTGNHMKIWKWFSMNDGTKADLIWSITEGSEYKVAKQKVKNFLLCCMADHLGQPIVSVNCDLAESVINAWVEELMLGYQEMRSSKLSTEQLRRTKDKLELRSQQVRLNRIKAYNETRRSVRLEEKMSRSIEDLKLEELKIFLSAHVSKIETEQFHYL